MPFLPGRKAVSFVVAASAVLAALLLTRPEPVGVPGKTAGTDRLVLTWIDGGDRLQVDGVGYRPKAIVEIRLGNDPIQPARADDMGRVRVQVPRRIIVAGQPGASITVIGRSKFGLARALISAVPPRATGRGPIDALPWAVAFVVLAGIGLSALHRRRRGPAAPAAGAAPGRACGGAGSGRHRRGRPVHLQSPRGRGARHRVTEAGSRRPVHALTISGR
jgi:hypothetical protein